MRLSGQDVRLAVRTLVKHPGFTTVAVVSLALAIALNTTMYSVIDALVNPKLDMREPDRLYFVRFYGNPHRPIPRTAMEEALASGRQGYEGVTGSGVYRPMWTPVIEHGDRFVEGQARFVRPDYFAL